jgi:hypothetical protein
MPKPGTVGNHECGAQRDCASAQTEIARRWSLRLASELPVRCHFMSDLHMESQDFPWRLPRLRQEGPSARAIFDI